MPRPLPSDAEARAILARKRTRPTWRPAPSVGKAMAPLIKALDERFGQGPGALEARWREIVGDNIARRTQPVKLVKNRAGGPATLEIRVAGPAAALIQHQSEEILARVNLFLGAGAVGKLRIAQGPVKPPPQRDAAVRRDRPRAGPLDAAAEAELTASLDRAKDDDLKEALRNLGRAVLKHDDRRR